MHENSYSKVDKELSGARVQRGKRIKTLYNCFFKVIQLRVRRDPQGRDPGNGPLVGTEETSDCKELSIHKRISNREVR